MAELLQFTPFTRPAPFEDIAERPDTRTLADTEARAAALDIQRSWIVEAPAGSGKTGLLIQRYLKLLAHGDVQRPNDVLVLTFTRKADGELRDRVLHQLKAAHANDPVPSGAGAFERETRAFADAVLARDRARGWRLLESPSQFNIRTIDSFCSELAASRPILAGGSGRRAPVDDAFPLYRAAAERTIAALGGSIPALNDALRRLLLHRDAQVQDTIGLLAGMLAQREQWGELIPLTPSKLTEEHLDTEVRPRLERTLARIITAGLRRAADALGPENVSELAHFAARVSTEPGYNADANPLACCSSLQGTLPATADHLLQWQAVVDLLLTKEPDWRKKPNKSHLKFDLSRQNAQWLEQFISVLQQGGGSRLRDALAAVRALPPARYPDDQWPLVKALCRILHHGLTELQQVFSQRAQTDFTEIALTARTLLRPDPADDSPFAPDPFNTPAGTLTHLLVDEMQDTSAGQYELLESLTRSWDGASQTVFLVGDPKQSIYAFRQARVERFLRTMDTGRLGDLPLGALRLSANFRSQATLVDAFNQTFREILPAPSNLPAQPAGLLDPSTVPFVSASPSRPATTERALFWHAYLKPDPAQPLTSEPPLSNQPETQARDIRRHIEVFLSDWPKRPVPSGQLPRAPRIAVLARNRAHLAPILAELRGQNGQAPLPFRAVDVEALNERPEVLDLLALTRALLHPADRVAWLAVLHSPLCGLTRADLLALTGEGPDADRDATVLHLVQTRRHFLSTEGQDLLARTWPALLEAHATLGRTALHTHIERTWRSLGGDAPLTPDRHANALRFFDLLARLQSGPDLLSLSLLQDKLKKLYAEPMAGEPAVELMTIHKAKGLEWDLVLVPSLDRGSGRNAPGLFKWLELDNPEHNGTEADFLLAPIQGKGEQASTLSTWLTAGELQRAMSEAQRLFYVACTRAREELHLFATVERKRDGSLARPTAESLLRAAWTVAEPILDRQLQSPQFTLPAPSANLVAFAQPAATPQPLSLAAAAEEPVAPARAHRPATIQRLPADFDPRGRFRLQDGAGLRYTPAIDLPHSAVFARPEGSFGARAFGNVVHRFLQVISTRLATNQTQESLLAELPSWHSRLSASLRNEGLAISLATTEAQRALQALTGALHDSEGAWLLGPHLQARNEASIGAASTLLRADRTFLAGPAPLSHGQSTHLWILDYKTAELGGRSRDAFLAEQKGKYLPQMQTYAEVAASTGPDHPAIVLALYFPMLPALLYWPADEEFRPK